MSQGVQSFPVGRYQDIKWDLVVNEGYAEEVRWSEEVGAPESPDTFLQEYAFVVVNSGMKNTIARAIYERVMAALSEGKAVSTAFGHPGKAAAIQAVSDERVEWFSRWGDADDKLAFLESMPWIGPITKYHLGKNYGLDLAKPDRHLVRIAEAWGAESVHELCSGLAEASGDRIGTVDLVLWRASTLGWLLTP